ncbi:MAG: hypothetical protein GEU76_03855 [Alphaproteobacteria bacterium]|nr:hypothetical protein [Alphaproteobacteria bacterium]
MKTLTDEGLKPAHEKFAVLLAKGLNQADAYRGSHNCDGLTNQRIGERASKLAARGPIKARVRALLRQAKVSDLDSVGQAFKDILKDIEEARQAKNWTAVAQMSRLRVQCHGMILDKGMILSPTADMTDAQLITRIAGGDEELAARIKFILGPGEDEFRQ